MPTVICCAQVVSRLRRAIAQLQVPSMSFCVIWSQQKLSCDKRVYTYLYIVYINNMYRIQMISQLHRGFKPPAAKYPNVCVSVLRLRASAVVVRNQSQKRTISSRSLQCVLLCTEIRSYNDRRVIQDHRIYARENIRNSNGSKQHIANLYHSFKRCVSSAKFRAANQSQTHIHPHQRAPLNDTVCITYMINE